MRFNEFKKGPAGQAKGKDKMPKAKPGRKDHPLHGKLVGEEIKEAAQKGREYNHLEDLVFFHGSEGANKAADELERLGKENADVAIKWDGYPTMYWGREDDGQFVLVGKNGWGRNKSTSSEDLYKFITSTGKGEDWRERFGKEMAAIFDIMEAATPPDFRGYVYGDLLYHPGKPFNSSDDSVEFTPNLVTYTVKKKSQLGGRIADSKVGVVVHTKYDEFGSKSGQPISEVDNLNSNDVVVLGQTYVSHQPKVDTAEVKEIRSMISKYGPAIDQFLAPVKGLSDMHNIIYTYVNQTSRARQLDNLENGFFDWLSNSKVSANKQAKIAEMNKQMPKALPGMFALVKKIMTVKDHIIQQLDDADADVKQSTKGEKGGEGYVALGSKTKLVPRTRWQPN
jgi:hypothetical protein